MRAAAMMLRFQVLVASALTFGCNSDPAAPEPDPFEDQQAAYPPGPYGYTPGSILEDFEFMGLLNPKAVNYEASDKTLTKIAMHDFYNPGKDPSKPRALLVTESALWCAVCQVEGQSANDGHSY